MQAKCVVPEVLPRSNIPNSGRLVAPTPDVEGHHQRNSAVLAYHFWLLPSYSA